MTFKFEIPPKYKTPRIATDLIRERMTITSDHKKDLAYDSKTGLSRSPSQASLDKFIDKHLKHLDDRIQGAVTLPRIKRQKGQK